MQFSQLTSTLGLKETHAVLIFLCCNVYVCVWTKANNISFPTPPRSGDMKSSSPSESPLMEKREMREPQCPILKQTATETSTHITPAANQDVSAQPPAPSEERRVAFDIGDSDDVDNNKERRVAFDIGDSDDTDDSSSSEGMFSKKHCFYIYM